MTQSDYQWWGFRIRAPLGYDPPPVSRTERLAFAMAVASILCGAIAAVLVVVPILAGSGAVALPLAVVALAAAAAWLAPRGLVDESPVAAWMMLAREKGGVARWDRWLGVAAGALAALTAFRAREPFGPALIVSLAAVSCASFLLALQETVCSVARRWPIDIPEWLKDELPDKVGKGEKDTDPIDGVVGPEEGAQPVYGFRAGDQEYDVGVKISDDLLAAVREINCESTGCLYLTNAPAVVLMDRPPAEGFGREQIERLCAQILSIARKHRMGPLALANATLAFVQAAIRYGYDEDTTGGFPGGPFQEYGRMPVETLYDGVGDCECTSILTAAILSYLSFDVALLFVTVPAGYHVAVGLSTSVLPDGDSAGLDVVEAEDHSARYLYGETATDSEILPFGSIPACWKEQFEVRRVVPIGSPQSSARRAAA